MYKKKKVENNPTTQFPPTSTTICPKQIIFPKTTNKLWDSVIFAKPALSTALE